MAARSAPYLLCAALWSGFACGGTLLFSTGNPDGRMATASRPGTTSNPEIESADDFILGGTGNTILTGAAFTGLIPLGSPLATISEVIVEIYRIFPADSNNPPDGKVPTRVNSPSDVAFDSRDSAGGALTFTPSLLNPDFSAANSVLIGINASPNQTTGGEGSVAGQEVQFNVDFVTPFTLPAGHYFFVPQVLLTSGNFFWLSASGPPSFTGDLQEWIRNEALAPDWLRVGTDIVGGTTPPRFNAAFSLIGEVAAAPEPGSLVLAGCGLLALWWCRQRGKR